MNNRWGIHAPNAGFRRMEDFYAAGFQNYTVLHVNENLIPQIREKYPNARILVRMYLQNWYATKPEDWARDVTDIANRIRPHTNEITWANEQNLDLEGHPQGASINQPVPPASLYRDIDAWNLEMIRRLRESIPWARLHYPAFANDHSDDKNQGGYVGLEICRPSIERADVMDCHCYWRPDDGPLTLDGGQRFTYTHSYFPDKPIFISECGNFAVQDPRSPDQYIAFLHSLYHYPYVEGATFFIWDSDAAPENALNVIQRSGALVQALRSTSKDAPADLPPVPPAPPLVARTGPAPGQPAPTEPVPASGEYIVAPGDTLTAIAKRFGVTVLALMQENGIADARLLRAGQRLRIPGAAGPVPAPEKTPPAAEPVPEPVPAADGTVYVVQSGDTVSAIAARFHVTVQAIVKANNLADPRLIRPGQKLVIPPASLVLGVPESESEPQVQAPAKIAARVYITRKGDTIARVAEIFGMDAQLLAQANRVGTRGEIMPGTRLKIPPKGN